MALLNGTFKVPLCLENYHERLLTRIITEEKNYYQLGANQQNVGPFRE